MLLTAWIIYFLVTLKLKTYNVNQIFYVLSIISIFGEYILEHYSVSYNPFILYFAGIVFAHLNIKKYSITIPFTVYYLALFLSSLYFKTGQIQDVLTILSIFGLFYLVKEQTYSKMKEFIITFIVVLSIILLFDKEVFTILNTAIPIFLTLNLIDYHTDLIKKNIEEFKLKIAKTIDAEVKKEIEKLEIKLQLAYKKLKEIFRLNSYTIKEIDIDEMADKVVKGLIDLGYIGCVLELENFNILKKEGYIPNFKRYVDDIFKVINTVEIFEEGKCIVIPIFTEENRFGTLLVYSRNEILPEEIEYLMTYAKSVGTAMAKVDYFVQIIRLRDLIYTAVDSINIPLVITRNNFKIGIANKAFLNFVSRKDVINFDLVNLLPFLEEKKEEIINRIVNNREPLEWITKIYVHNRDVSLNIRVYPVISENRVESIVFIIEDITEKEEMERQIIQSEKLAVIGRLAAGLSHEIKNPLAIISQSAYSLKRRINKKCDESMVKDIIEPLERIERSSHRAKDIIDRLLNFAKPYYNDIQRVNLKDVIEESIKLAVFQANKSEVKISSKLKDLYMKGDKNSLIQLFLNLIINAFESIPSKGKVTITLTYLKRNKLAKVSIKDTGIGIPPDVIDRIFEPFFTTKEKGTGLGLSVAYRIVKDHNGDIKVKSVEGEGTEFIIYLPVYEDGNGE
ncbi:MAG: ATP-binding protein [Hydrogenothermaceae bacterium]|nr:ATP-binding protein [Hydrogenothermaceae bacterium]